MGVVGVHTVCCSGVFIERHPKGILEDDLLEAVIGLPLRFSMEQESQQHF